MFRATVSSGFTTWFCLFQREIPSSGLLLFCFVCFFSFVGHIEIRNTLDIHWGAL